MIGSDTWGLEVMDPSKPPPEAFGYCHMNLIVRCGISNFENLDLDVLSQEKVYEFLFTWSPLKLVGATGSPGNPIAAAVTQVGNGSTLAIAANGDVYATGSYGATWTLYGNVFGAPTPTTREPLGGLKVTYR